MSRRSTNPSEREQTENPEGSFWPGNLPKWLQEVCYLDSIAPPMADVYALLGLLPGCGVLRYAAPRTARVDAELEANANTLRETFAPFGGEVTVTNGPGGDDGWVKLPSNPPFIALYEGLEGFELAVDGPIEIGSTKPTTTYKRLMDHGMVARLPYRHTVVTVLALNPKARLAAQRQRASVFDALIGKAMEKGLFR